MSTINPFYLLGALVIGYLLGRSRVSPFQNHGEALVCRELQANFSGPDFHLLNHITLKLKDGTTQVDHILVSRFGVFVIETKDYKGWIFASAKHATWTQVLYRVKFKFQNPIFQNMRHVRAVEELLDFLPPEAIKSAVVFKTDMPSGVYTLSGLIDHLKSATEEVMSLNRVQFCVGRLETARLAITGQTDLEHVKSLQRKHGGPR
jgi:Nuclease-related domain